MVVRLQILGGVEFAAKGYLNLLKPEDAGYASADFWPGALKSVTYEGVGHGILTNNETMGFIWNAKIFKDAGLDPESPPATWDDVVTYSKTIHDKLGIAGYGLVARQNAGNTPFRFMPQDLGIRWGRTRRDRGRADLQDRRDQQRRHQGRAAGCRGHVGPRQVGADFGAHQHNHGKYSGDDQSSST